MSSFSVSGSVIPRNITSQFGDGFEHIVGTVRGAERAAALNAPSVPV